jgi:hypothetical protein
VRFLLRIVNEGSRHAGCLNPHGRAEVAPLVAFFKHGESFHDSRNTMKEKKMKIGLVVVVAILPLLTANRISAQAPSQDVKRTSAATSQALRAALSMQVAAGHQTAYSQNAYAPACAGDCKSNECNGFGKHGCASCVVLEAYVPLKAVITDKRCMTTANYPGDSAIHRVDCTTDNAWSVFDAPTVTNNGFAQVVRTMYHNRSGNRTRVVHLEVDYR